MTVRHLPQNARISVISSPEAAGSTFGYQARPTEISRPSKDPARAKHSDVGFINEMTGSGDGDVCPLVGGACKVACNVNGCGGDSSGAYETTTQSKVQAIHEWNWNCASGNAPEDPAKWMTGPVEGEPESSRGPFVMCQEDGGWYCPFEEGPDLKMEAGKDAPKEIEEGGSSVISVATMTLPVIDGGRSVAASVSL